MIFGPNFFAIFFCIFFCNFKVEACDVSRELVTVADRRLRIVYANAAVEKLLGFSA